MNRTGKLVIAALMGMSLMVAVGGAGAPKAPPAPKMPAFPAFPSAPKAAPVKEAPAIKTDEKAAEPAPGTKPTSREGEAEGDDATAAKSGAETPEATPGKELARDRYRVILVRNPFGLNPPPPPVVETAPEPEPEPDLTIYLTGITTLLGTKKAFLKTDDPKETDKLKKFRYYTLKEGEARDGLEVVSIDVETGSVKINHKSASRTLNLEDDGIEAVAAPVSAPGKPGGAKLPPGMSRAAATARPGTVRPVSRPTTTRTTTPRPVSSSTRTATGSTSASARPTSINIPGRNPRSTATSAQSLNGGRTVNLPIRPTRSSNAPLLPPPPKVDPQEQKILMELNREVNRLGREQEDLIMPPLPPIDQ